MLTRAPKYRSGALLCFAQFGGVAPEIAGRAEAIVRLHPPGKSRFRRSGSLEVSPDAAMLAARSEMMNLPVLDQTMAGGDLSQMMRKARNAADFLKALSHEGRLMILCHLSTGEKSVSDLEALLSSRQAAVSQQLARLRLEGLVDHRRDGKTIFYRLNDDRARRTLELLYEMFCAEDARQ